MTLHGQAPLIIGHRGLPGLYPEEVIAGYRAAIAAGTDALELDLQSSSDGVLFACHNVYLSDTTDVANHPEFASRRKSRMLDGVPTGPDWYISDFTARELKTLRVRQPVPVRSKQYDGLYPMATFQEIIDLAKQAMAADPARTIYVYPETKNPLYQRQLGHPLEEKLLAMLEKEGWNTPDAPVFVQSFDPQSLKLMRRLGLKTKVVQLIDGSDIDYRTGAIVYTSPDSAKPASWLQAGDPRTFAAMVTPAGLAEIRTYADGIGPWKFYLLPARGIDAAGHPVTALAEAWNAPPTSLLRDAHAAGLFVHPYTFRDEPPNLTRSYHGDPKAEYAAYFSLGVDGVFTDFSTTARQALTQWLGQGGSAGSVEDSAVTVQMLADRAQIEDLLTEYYGQLGGRDADLGHYYTEDGVLDVNGLTARGRKPIEALYAQIAQGSPRLRGTFRMLLTNPRIVVHGDSASADVIWTGVISETVTAAPRFVEQGREHDELVKRDGRWYFRNRVITSDGGLPAMFEKSYRPR